MPSQPGASHYGVIESGEVPPLLPKPAAPRQNEPELIEPILLDDDIPVAPAPPKLKPKPAAAMGQPRAAITPKHGTPNAILPAGDEEHEGRATQATWQQMVLVYGVSMILHAAVLVILAFIVLPQQVREQLLTVIAKQVKEEEGVPPPLEHIIQEPDLIQDLAVKDSPNDITELVKSEGDIQDKIDMDMADDAFRLQPETTEGSSVPLKPGSAAGRSQQRGELNKLRGGNEASDAAVSAALEWLASVQRRDGSWDYNDLGKSSGKGNLSSPTGATGLALLAFLGAGHTHMKECKYQETVKRGLDYLLKAGIPRPAGLDFRGRSPGNEGMYVQAICTTALAEAHGMTSDPQLRPIAQGAINFIVRAQHADGGWRYEPNTPGDTSVVGWQVVALKSAYHSKISIPRTVSQRINRFLADVSHEEGAKYSYMPDQSPRASTTSIGLLCRMYMGWKADNPALVSGVKYLAKTGPSRDDIYYDYYASQVLIQFTGAKGELWDKWNTVMRDWLVSTQKKSGPETGSWDVIEAGHKGERGGRLYTTCLAVMTLEIYYRVLPLYQRAAVEGEF